MLYNVEKWFLVIEGKVAEPYVQCDNMSQCLKWTDEHRDFGEFAQWIKITEITKINEDE
jgi:hypothetical protein